MKNRDSIMKEWDRWREYIAGGGKGSWPRDAFEALLDGIEQEKESLAEMHDALIQEFNTRGQELDNAEAALLTR